MAHTPVPAFFDPANAGKWSFSPNLALLRAEAETYRKKYGIAPASKDARRAHLLIIDGQKDFCLPPVFDGSGAQVGGGTLYVGGRSGSGAIDDSRRTAEFIYREMANISQITATMDTHFAHQIFFPIFWTDAHGSTLQPHTMISVDDLLSGKVKPHPAMAMLSGGNYMWLTQQVRHYAEELVKGKRYTLYLWPEHCILGSDGHALTGVIQEARMFHSYVRFAQSDTEVKGGHPLTENYSVFRPEVTTRFDKQPLAQKNARFIQTILAPGKKVLCGQAASHCVASSGDDLLAEIVSQDPTLAGDLYVVIDLMSAVAVPDGKGGFYADFTPQADEAFKRWEAAGAHLVTSTTPMSQWPNFND